MKRTYQTMIFVTLCLAAMVSPVAVQAQGDEELDLDEIQSNANPLQVIPGAPPEIQEAAAALLDSRDSIDLEKIRVDRPRPSFGPNFEATLVGIDEDHQAQLDEHIAALEEEFNNPSYASFNPQGLEPANERNFVPDESWPKTSLMVKNWPADDPFGYNKYVKKKWQEYESDDFHTTWTRNALSALVSDRAGECEDIPPAEWDTPLAVSGASQFCQKKMERFSGGITGEESVASAIDDWLVPGYTLDILYGDELLWCRNYLRGVDHLIVVESACWPNENPISGDKGNYLRLTMKGQLRCEKNSVADYYYFGPESACQTGPCPHHPEPIEITNATIVMDLPVCSGWDASEWSDPGWFDSSWRIVDPPPPKASRPAGTGRRLGNETMDELLDINDGN